LAWFFCRNYSLFFVFYWNPQRKYGGEEVYAENLEILWEIAFLPNRGCLITGKLVVLKGVGENTATHEISDVYPAGEGGYWENGPTSEFEENRFPYL